MTVTIADNGDGTKTIQVRGNTQQRFSIEGILATYDNITMRFYKTAEPRTHVGFAEILFGNMQRIQADRQSGTSTILEQTDPLKLQSYASRVDFTLFGIRDTDVTSFSRVAVSVNTRDGTGEPVSFDMGTFFVTSVRPVGKDMTQITAEDIRTIIDKNTVTLTISTNDSIRDKLIQMLTDLNVGYYIDMSLDVSPTQDVEYKDVTPIKVLTDVSCRYNIPITIGPRGDVHLTARPHEGRSVSASNIMTWAMSEASAIKPNFFIFDDGFEYDKRTDLTLPPVKSNISNGFFLSHHDRLNFLDRIDENMAANSVVIETTGDIRLEVGDIVSAQTRDGQIVIGITQVENRIGTSYRQKLTGLTREVIGSGSP